MSEFTTRVVVDDGAEFSPSVELCLAEPRGRGRVRLIPLSGRLMSEADIDGMVECLVFDVFEWGREAKRRLGLSLGERSAPLRCWASDRPT